MFELNGKYGFAKVFTDLVDQSAISQIIEMLNQPFVQGSSIRIMPDVHAGAGCTIGTTMTITDKIVPNLVGVDIGCGMETTRLYDHDIDFEKLDATIRGRIPSGFEIRKTPHSMAGFIDLTQLRCAKHIDLVRAENSIGTLGGGNHFIEVDRDESGRLYVVIHSGSRHLGVEVATYYQETGYQVLNKKDDGSTQKLIAELKATGRQRDIQKELQKLKNTQYTSIPKALAYVEGSLFDDYIHDMRIVQKFAELNRQAMMREIEIGMGLHIDESFTTIHNYIDMDSMILRKGAVSAQAGEKLIIPMNMRDGSLICVGKGNPDWNYSAPHGAGRLMSRAQAKESVSLEEFKQSMTNVWSTSVGQSTIDESPMAYKPMESILENIGDTVDVLEVIKPEYNFKAGEESRFGPNKEEPV